MRVWRISILALLVLMLAAPAAVAASSVTVKGRPAGAKKLSSAVTLPNGQTSRATFTLRKSGRSDVTGYAVSSTKYFESLNFSDYYRSTRASAYGAFRHGYAAEAKFVYASVSGSGQTYRVLKRVYYKIFGE